MRTQTHRLLTFLCSAALAFTLSAVEAQAETVKARRSSPVYADQGEKSKVITRVRAGKRMKVLRRDGRWVRVRVNGRTGWIPRSYLKTRRARSRVRKKRKVSFVEGRSRGREAKTAPKDRVGADTVEEDFISEFDDGEPKGKRVAKRDRRRSRRDDRDRRARAGDEFDEEEFDEEEFDEEEFDEDTVVVEAEEAEMFARPDDRDEPVDWAEEGDELWVIERDGDWILVENEFGDEGWVRAKDVGGQGYSYSKWTKRGRAGLGYSNMGQDFSSGSADPLGNYTVSSGSAVLAAGGELLYDYDENWILAGDGLIRYVRASPGIRYVDPNNANMVTDISYTQYKIDAGARAGYKLDKKTGTALYGRLGYHYGKTAIDNVSDFTVNIPKLPSEILSGFTVGAVLDIPKWNDKWSGQAALNVMTSSLGSLDQTQGLEDGNVSDTTAAFATARVRYKWKENLKIIGAYKFGYADTKWTGAAMESQRDHGATDAKRTDLTHTLMVGLGRLF